METQIGTMITGDFEENTMIFEIDGKMTLAAGKYAIVPIKEHEAKVKNLDLSDVSVCCDWKSKMKNLLNGLEAQHIDKFMDKANVNEYLEYGIAYMNEVRHIINKH